MKPRRLLIVDVPDDYAYIAEALKGRYTVDGVATVEEATVTAIKINELAEMTYRAHLLGDPRPISDDDIAVFRERRKNRAGPSPHLDATWRYYAKLTGA